MSKPNLFGLSLLSLAACSGGPPRPDDSAAPPPPPAWTQAPARGLNGQTLVFTAAGEDRTAAEARFKAEGLALQDLANECSLIPRTTQISSEQFSENRGILFRAYARVTVDAEVCRDARALTTSDAITRIANPELTAEVIRYQATYDPPEADEVAPLPEDPRNLIQDPTDATQLYTFRQQIVNAKHLSHPPGSLTLAGQKAAQYETAHPEAVKGAQTFSVNRKNWMDHQPAAVRETAVERQRIERQFPAPAPAPAKSMADEEQEKGPDHNAQKAQHLPGQGN